MSKEAVFIGEPIVFQSKIKIYPPTVKDIITNQNLSIYFRLLTYSQEEVEDEFLAAKRELEKYPTPIEFLLNNSYHHKDYELKCMEAFKFFIHEEVVFLYEQKMIVIGTIEEAIQQANSLQDLIILDEENFFDFQNCIRESFGRKTVEKPNPNEDPRIAEMKRKARRRDRLKEKQAAKKRGSKDDISIYTMLVSICCMGLGITPLNIGEMSYVAAESIMRKYQEKEKYDLDIDSLLAGADSKKIKPKYWIRNFED